MTTEVLSPGQHLKAVKQTVNKLLDGVTGKKEVDVSYDTRSATWRFVTTKRVEYKTTRLDVEAEEVLDIYERLERGEWVGSYIPPKSLAGNQQSGLQGQNPPIDINRSFTERIIDKGKAKIAATHKDWTETRRGHVQEQPKAKWSDDVLERAENLAGIKASEIREGGAYRELSVDERFWFPLNVLVEEEEANDSIKDDAEFFDTFRKIAIRYGLKASKTIKWEGSSSNSGYLSKWWKNDWGFSSGPGSAQAKEMAIALGVVNTTIQVVNDNPDVRWTVELAHDDDAHNPTSYTSFGEQKVVVSPQALLDKSLNSDDQIEITTGYSLHEASHVQYTGPLVDTLQKPTVLRPVAVAAILMNIIEDVRIEGLTMAKFPGFGSYFVKMLAYLWTLGKFPTAWKGSLNDKINVVIAIVRWEDEYRKQLFGHSILTPEMEAEFTWFTAWRDDYVAGRKPLRQSLEEALAHLAEDPQTKKELDQQTKGEEQRAGLRVGKAIEFMNSDEFKDMVEQAIKDLKSKGAIQETCPSPNEPNGKPQKIDAETAKEVDAFIKSEIRIEQVEMPSRFADRPGTEPQIEITKPVIDPRKQPKNSPLLARLKAAFVFRKARPMYSTRQLRSGTIDEELLANTAFGDYRVFEQRVIESDPDTQVTMLIDCSGSMSGHNLDLASELAHVMLTCLSTMKGVRVRVRAHTSETTAAHRSSPHGTCQIFRVWEPGEDIKRVFNMDQLPSAANYDGYAIGWCAEEMLKEQRPGEDMILIVLSDGRPAGGRGYYGGLPAMKHVRQVTDAYEKKGVTSIQIAVDPSVGPSDQKIMFKHFISFETHEKLPRQLTEKLISLFGG